MKLMNIDIREPKDLIEFGNDFYDRSAKTKRRQERQWLLNILFIIGDQLCSINERTGGINRVKIENDPEYMVRVVNNRIMPIYRTMVSKLTKNKPIPMATANSREEKDIQAARAATKLLTNHWLNLDLDEGHQEIAGWLVATGNVFVKQFYNPEKGEAIQLDSDVANNVKNLIQSPDDEIEPDEKTKRALNILDKTELMLGDTDLIIRNSFNCYPEPGKTRIEKMSIFGDSEYLTKEEIFDKYNITVDTNLGSKDKSIYSIGIGDIVNTGEFDFEVTNDSLIEVREIHILPNKKFKRGATYKWINDKLVDGIEGVKPCNEIPITHLGLIRVPGKFWCEPLITDLIPMQRRWNELLSKIEMHNDLYNDPPIVVDPNVIDIDAWVNKPGLLLEKLMTGGEEPWVMKVPPLDQAIFQEINILDKQFEIVPVLNKVSFGKDTPNARSGLAINYLQEKDDDVIRPLIVEMETGFTKIFKRDFKLCQKNYKEDRGFAIVGEDNKVEWLEFLRSNLTANIDVKVEPGSAMPRSIAAQQAMILELMDRGFFVDPKTGQMDYGRISRYMEFGGIEEMYEDVTLNVDHARRCIEKLKHGEPVIVQEWFDVNSHLYEVNRFRKTTGYEELEGEAKFLIDNYANQCLALVQPTSIVAPDGTEIPLIKESARPNSPSGPGPSGPNSVPVVPPSTGAASTSPAGVAPPAGEGPLSEDEIRAMLSRLRVLKPDMWKQIKDIDPNVIAGMLSMVMKSAQETSNAAPTGQ